MKYANNKINIVSVVFLAATLYSCSAQDESLNLAKFQNSVQTNSQIADSTTATSNDIAFSNEIRSFEENYTKSMGSNSDNSVLLFGYKTMNVTGKDKEVLEWQCRKYKKEIGASGVIQATGKVTVILGKFSEEISRIVNAKK